MPYLNYIDFAKVREALQAGRDFFGGADTAQLDEALTLMAEAADAVASPDLRDVAESIYASDEIEVDDEGVGTSVATGGTWVQGWLWVPSPDDGRPLEEDA